MSRTAPQPAPLPSSAAPVWPLVIADASERLAGPALPLLLADMEGYARDERRPSPSSGYDPMINLYGNLLTACANARAEIEEGDPSGLAVRLYAQALDTLLVVRGALDRRCRAREAVRVAALGSLPETGWPAAGELRLADDLGLDSLAIVEVAIELDTVLDIDIADEALRACVTVGDLARAAERAMARRRT